MSKQKKFVDRDISDRLWRKRLIELLEAYLVIHKCNSCGSPVNDGHVCIFCDDNDPTSKFE